MSSMSRANLFISSWLCLLIGSGIIFLDTAYIVVGAPVAIAGSVLFVAALARIDEPRSMSEKQIREWLPDSGVLPEGAEGSIMYRVDTTLDEPYKSTILCGSCGEVTAVDGKRPKHFTCPSCENELWEEE